MLLLVSQYDDVNIFHFFAVEINAVWNYLVSRDKDKDICLYLQKYDATSSVHRWRLDVLRAIIPTYTNIDEVSYKQVQILPMTDWIVNSWTFITYNSSPNYMALARKVKDHYKTSELTGTHAVFVSRNKSRILYDIHTKRRLEDMFTELCNTLSIPHRVVSFDKSTLEDQARALGDAKVMISCHGAANTNIFLLPDNGHLLEINFRRHWYCDPVCDQHFNGNIGYKTKCNGRLTFRPYFHKADYHNICHLFGKGYTELEVEDASGFLDRNPINVKTIYVDARKVFAELLSKI